MCFFRSSAYACILFSNPVLGLKIMWVVATGPNLKFCADILLEGLKKYIGIIKVRVAAEN